MLPTNEKCVYCCQAFDPARGDGDHVLPDALGRFQGAYRFRGICVACNNRIGRSEQNLLQCGPDSIFRSMINATSKRTKRRGTSILPAVDGVPTPTFTVEHQGYRRLVHRTPDDPRSVTAIDSMTVKDNNEREVLLPLFEGMRVEDVRNRLRMKGIDLGNIKEVFISASEMEKGVDLVREIWPDFKLTELPPDEEGVYPARVRVDSKITTGYYQAIAKMALHYYLVTTSLGLRGDEACFEGVRDFIMNGGEKDAFFGPPAFEFALPVGSVPSGAWLPMDWCHGLAARDADGVAIAYVRLFVGPENVGDGHYVILGSLPTKLSLPCPAWGHVYVHEPIGEQAEFAGRVVTASISRLR